LEGGRTDLQELAELIYSDFSPSSAWAAWQWVADGLYFEGQPDDIGTRSAELVESERNEREAKEKAKREWAEFIERLQRKSIIEQDREGLKEVENLALNRSESSRILKTLGHQETRENAHRLLVSVGYWPAEHNPYPQRFNVATASPAHEVPPLPDEQRLDLTHLAAFAIDDEGNQDPDDAISLDGERLWVHVADVAALVAPDSAMDHDARGRGANLYVPERIVPMLPPAVTEQLGLGLQEVSPALSIGFCYKNDRIDDVQIAPSWIKVQRLSYEEVEQRIEEASFAALKTFTEPFRALRHARDAAAIELPEVSVKVIDGKVRVRALPKLQSRELVTDAMLMAGEAVGRYCQAHSIPIPYATQPAPDELQNPQDMAAMWAYRKKFKPSRLSIEPAAHFGLGLEVYTRVTSPLRRYSDLLVHQQLRAHLQARSLLDEQQVAERIDLADAGSLAIRRAERLSNTHWKLVWLRQNPQWKGEAVVVDQMGQKALVLAPELALDSKVRIQGDAPLNSRVELSAKEIDLADLACYFRARVK
jgi:exoribonuclease-2